MLNLNEQEIEEMKSDVNYFIKQLIADRNMLQDEVNYLKGQNEMLKGRLENEA